MFFSTIRAVMEKIDKANYRHLNLYARFPPL